MLWLFGPIRRVRGMKSQNTEGVEWQYILTGETESGVLFCAQNSTQAILNNGARIYGTKGWVDIPDYWKARKAVFHFPEKPDEVIEFPCEHELVYEVQHICDCFRKGRMTSPVVTEEISVAGIAALEQIKKNW